MAWTTLTLVRNHLAGPAAAARTVLDEPVKLTGSDSIGLAYPHLTEEGVSVKAILASQPIIVTARLSNDWVIFGSGNVVPGSAVLVEDEFSTQFFIEGVDFVIDYTLGAIKRLPDAAFGEDAYLQLFYTEFTIFTEGIDYTLDREAGTVKRIPGGAIPDPFEVFVDYGIAEAAPTDTMLEQAIEEAEAKIVAKLSSQYSANTTHDMLTIGATELACAIGSRALASRPLLIGKSGAEVSASRWMALAQKYEADAWKSLEQFLSKPARRTGYTVAHGA